MQWPRYDRHPAPASRAMPALEPRPNGCRAHGLCERHDIPDIELVPSRFSGVVDDAACHMREISLLDADETQHPATAHCHWYFRDCLAAGALRRQVAFELFQALCGD